MKKTRDVAETPQYEATRIIAEATAQRLRTKLIPAPTNEFFSLDYGIMDIEFIIFKKDGKHYLELRARPRLSDEEAQREALAQFQQYAGEWISGYKALREHPRFAELRGRRPNLVSDLEKLLPIDSLKVNGTGLRITYAISDKVFIKAFSDEPVPENKKELSELFYDSSRSIWLFSQLRR